MFQQTSYWNVTEIRDIDGAPGLSSGVFDGMLYRDVHTLVL